MECTDKTRCSCKNRVEHPSDRDASTVVPFICPDDALYMARHVEHAEKSTTSKMSAEVAEA